MTDEKNVVTITVPGQITKGFAVIATTLVLVIIILGLVWIAAKILGALI